MIKNWKTENAQVKIIFLGMLFVLMAILVPLFIIGHYNFRSLDDFSYAANPEQIWKETHSVWAVLVGQVKWSIYYYNNWQGLFFSTWLSTSLIGLFSENAYYVGTYLSLGGLVLAELFMIITALRKIFQADFWQAATVALGCVCLQILLTPHPVEAYYWFCSSSLYTIILALALVLMALIIRLYWYQGSRAGLIGLSVGIGILAFAVGGSNYVIALTMLLICGMAMLYFFWRKNRARYAMLTSAVIFLVSFLVSVTAPGNTSRQASAGAASLSVAETIVRAFKEAGQYVVGNTMLPCVILGLMLAPFFVRFVRNKAYRYPLPGVFSAMSFCLFAAQYAPTLYALGIVGANRVLNIYRFTFYLFLYVNELYWIGWLMRRRAGAVDEAPGSSTKCYLLQGWTIGGAALVLALALWGGDTLTAYSAVQSLRKGEAQQYYREYQERLVILEDDSQKNVQLPAFSVKPYLLYFNDIVKDPEDWVNVDVARYFGKESVQLIE